MSQIDAPPLRDGEITIADVAMRAGVSIRTVSRVLNRSPKVNAETRERVESFVQEMGFQRSARARGLATGRSYLVGVVYQDRNALVIDAVQRGIVSEAAERGYELVVHPAPVDQDPTLNDVMNFVRRSHVDGVVVLPPMWEVSGIAAALQLAKVPAIAFSSIPVPGFLATLLSDERNAAAQVARYLLAMGHRQIAMISGPASVPSARERRAGFVSAIEEAGCQLAAEAEGDYGFESGLKAAERLLALGPNATAIFAANDVMAAGVLKAAASRGIKVPDDLSVASFDGSILASMLTPALTTVHRPLRDMGRAATACLIDLIEGQPTQTDLRSVLTLIEGESCTPPRA